jgi:hypothetical protein
VEYQSRPRAKIRLPSLLGGGDHVSPGHVPPKPIFPSGFAPRGRSVYGALTGQCGGGDRDREPASGGRQLSPARRWAGEYRDRSKMVWERHPLGDAVETFFRREDAERFIEEVRGDDPKLASYLRIEEREVEAGGLN